MDKNLLPSVSIVIPTLNSSRTIGDCLDSILMQDYPEDKLEILIADGGSNDNTLDIIKKKLSAINYQLLDNPLKTGEAGKAVGVKKARNEIIALIDSDNILPQADWLRRMIEPFQDKEIVASEPLYFTYRRTDSYITRYSALLGMNDPICMWVGNYDRYSILTGKWTEVLHSELDQDRFLKLQLRRDYPPTMGANGFLVYRDVLLKCDIGEYLFDIDIICNLLNQGMNFRFSKVKIGIIHIYARVIKDFIKKQKRRVRDYKLYRDRRMYPWVTKNYRLGIVKFILYNITVVPLVIQSLKGYLKKPDVAWWVHPLACEITFWIYGIGIISGLFKK